MKKVLRLPVKSPLGLLSLIALPVVLYLFVAELFSWRPQVLASHPRTISTDALAFSPDGKWLVGGSADGLRLWDVSSRRQLWTQTAKGRSLYFWSVTSAAFSPDGKTIASGGMYIRKQIRDYVPEIRLWNSETGALQQTIKIQKEGEFVLSIVFSPDSRLLASAGTYTKDSSTAGVVRLWDVKTRQAKKTTIVTGIASAVAFAPDGRTLASWSAIAKDDMVRTDGGELRIWDVQSGKLLRILKSKVKDFLSSSLVFSPDGKLVACAFETGRVVQLWDVQKGKLLRTLALGKRVHGIAFSPDSETLASANSDGTIVLWNAKTGTLERTINGYPHAVESVAFSPDGRTVASGGGLKDGTVKLWRVF